MRWFALALALASAGLGLARAQEWEMENNDEFSFATPIGGGFVFAPFGTCVAGSLDPAGDVDYFTFTPLTPGILYWRSRELPSEVPYLAIALSLALVPLAIGLGAGYYLHSWGVRGQTLRDGGTNAPSVARRYSRRSCRA